MIDQSLIFNLDLIQRYDKAGPRYTSYPTALELHEGFFIPALGDTEVADRTLLLIVDGVRDPFSCNGEQFNLAVGERRQVGYILVVPLPTRKQKSLRL